MEVMFSNGMCRCCASEGTFKDLSSKYRWMGVDEVYADMLRECFDVTLSSPEESPEGGICEVCITQLRNAANFKKQVLSTEEQFKRMVQNKPFKSNIVKVEVNPPDDELHLTDEDNVLSNDDFSGAEYDVPIKTELEEGKTRKRSKAGPSRSKQAKLEGEPSGKRPIKSRKRIISIRPQPDRPPIQLTRSKEVTQHQENIAIILAYSNATPLRGKGRQGYACSFCPDEFDDPSDLKTHTTLNHNEVKDSFMKGHSLPSYVVKLDITNLACTLCKQSMPSLQDLTTHLQTHNKLYHTKVKSHIFPFNFDTESLKCALCRHDFNNFKVLLEHMNKHFPNYVCKVCGVGFVNKRMLQSHSYRHLKGEFKCEKCEKIYDTKVKMKEHYRAVHVCKNKRSRCGYCDAKFYDNSHKRAHEASVHGARAVVVSCQACDKRFNSQRTLSAHLKVFHMLGGRGGKGAKD